MTEDDAPAGRRGWRKTGPRFSIGILLILLLGMGLATWRLFFYRSPAYKSLQALRTAFLTGRPLEARLSGFPYAPFGTLRGAAAKSEEAYETAGRFLFEGDEEDQTAESCHVRGLYYVAKRQYDRAIELFKTALQEEAQDARLHNDLGATLLEKGRGSEVADQQGKSIEVLAEGLAHLNKALLLDPGLHEALFNRALLLQQLIIIGRAGEDWTEYLSKDAHSPWAAEARQHLDLIESDRRRVEQSNNDLLGDFLDSCRTSDEQRAWALFSANRERLTAELLDLYLKGAARPTGDPAREALGAIAYAGDLDARRTGDRYTADLARFYQSASRPQLAAAAEAHKLLNQARESYLRVDLQESVHLYAKARQILYGVSDICEARLVTLRLGLASLEMSRTEQSASLFETLARDCEADQYNWLKARALFYKSGVEFNRGEYSRAIVSAKQAHAGAEKAGDRSCMLSASSALVEYYRLLGNRNECLGQLSLSLPLLESPPFNPISLGRHYGITAMAFNTFGLYDAAIDCQREALRLAQEVGDFVSLSVAYAHLGLIYGKLQNFSEAFKNIEAAYSHAESHAGEIAGQEKMAYAALQMGNLHREAGDIGAALASYDRSISLYQSIDFPTHLYQAYKGRLACYLAQKDVAAVEQQLADIMALLERYRTNIFEEENRNDFFDIEQTVYDLAIDFEYSLRQDEHKAFEYAEASRARSLLDSVTAGAQAIEHAGKLELLLQAGARPLPLPEIQGRIPDRARLLQFAVLQDKLLIWVISRDRLEHVAEVNISQAALSGKVSSYLISLRGSADADAETTRRLAGELYGYLFSPVEPMIGDSRILYIVPDKVLNRLPWDALISPTSGEFIAQTHLLTLSPSATLFAICTDLANQKAGARAERIASVGNPSFDRLAFRLDPLPDAEFEAKRVAELYSSRAIVGAAAREQAVRDDIARADVAHFALHCVINERYPIRSALVLAKEPGDDRTPQMIDGQLQAHEFYDMRLPHLRLAVLSACETGVERYYRGEGMIGMARAFLVARVPLVVASLWPVESRSAAELMILFHRYRKRDGLPTAEALWRAKRDLLQGPVESYRRPFYWAAFQTIGGYAGF